MSALPNAMALVCGRPSMKSARSDPVAAPVKPKLPRGFCWLKMSKACRRTPPPIVRLWRPRNQKISEPPPLVRLVLAANCPVLSPAMLVNASDGGPQLAGL